jgi:hypothetical protein
MQVGVTVYLEGPPELLAKRVLAQDGAASRPLLAPSDTAEALEEEETVERLRNLLKERDTSYRNADCIVSLAGDGEYGASAPQVCSKRQFQSIALTEHWHAIQASHGKTHWCAIQACYEKIRSHRCVHGAPCLSLQQLHGRNC